MEIRLATSDAEVESCYPVMRDLRPRYEPSAFLQQVRRQMNRAGYRLAYLVEADAVRAVAGFRISECLAWGRFLYVDDLVTDGRERSRGHGGELLRWLVQHAREQDCQQLHLDSGVQRFAAHRFYLREGMAITSHHFALELAP
jgi:GNAT superfamily N-acetyltransferase